MKKVLIGEIPETDIEDNWNTTTQQCDEGFSGQSIHTDTDRKYDKLSPFPFLSLPRELRDVVYGFLVPKLVTLNRHSEVWVVDYRLVNRQFASEIMERAYGLHTFSTEAAIVTIPRGLSEPIRYV